MLTLDETLAAHPFPFQLEQLQIEDIHRLVELGRGLGDLPVGYGKTAISTAAALMCQPDVTLILMPPILVTQWVKWLRSIPGTGMVIAYEGPPKVRSQFRLGQAQWICASYGLFRNDFDRFVQELHHLNVMTIVDEAHNMKNHNSLLFEGVRDFSEGRRLIQMSGTPMSWPGDAYSYIKINSPETYVTYRTFENIHVEERDFFDKPTKWRELDLMQENLSKVRVYRSKEEVHSALPKATYVPIYYDLDPEHMKLYRKLMTEQLIELDDGSKIDASTAQTLYHNAQQIITNWGHFASDPTKKAKVFDLIDEVCEQINLGAPDASKLILWTQYQLTSGTVQEYMDIKLREMTETVVVNKRRVKVPLGRYSMAAYGKANSKKSVAAFLDDPNCVNLTAQPGSAGAGLNPQHLCWYTAFVEFPTRTIQFVQASGRIDRKGQIYNPTIALFVARGTVQETLLANLLSNDDEVVRASGTKNSVRDLIFPKEGSAGRILLPSETA